MKIKSIYIFDIDGTISNLDHRLHYLEETPPNWDAFYDACDKDLPKPEVLNILRCLDPFAQILFFTGRTESCRQKTLTWLEEHTPFPASFITLQGMLTMRPDGNFRADHILKEEWLNRMLLEDRNRIAGVFDDRASVVEMWRRNGLTCFQVAEGNF